MSAAEKEQMKRELHSLNVAISVNVVIMLAKVREERVCAGGHGCTG
jgi:hypothetical protein